MRSRGAVPGLPLRLPLAGLLLLAAGCEPELGACDMPEARRLVYDRGGGSPAYEGQALMIQSCGSGAFCHSEGIDASERFGAPHGLDYDLRLVGADGLDEEASATRLATMHERVFSQRRFIWQVVENGSMPPAVLSELGAPEYVRVDRAAGTFEPMPTLTTTEGREALRNWLACGMPIVERDAPSEQASAGQLGDVVSPFDVEPLQPNWTDIHDRLIGRRCASAACHGSTGEGELRLDGGAEAALGAMREVASAGEDCVSGGAVMIVPGDPDASLLVHKLTGRVTSGSCTTDADCTAPATCDEGVCSAPVCGRLMPIGGSRVSAASVEAIRQWIMAGANAE